MSAVDAKTEREILGGLQQNLSHQTVIFITHRIFSLFRFDKIVVLENGRIAETGVHEELLARKGVYAEMYARQLREEATNGI